MKVSQRGITRKNNDIKRFLEDEEFNLGVNLGVGSVDDTEDNLEIKTYHEKPKRKSAFNIRLKELMNQKKKEQLEEREDGVYNGNLINKAELGKILGKKLNRKTISRQTIDSYTNGRVSPKIDIIIAMSQYFEVSCDYLLGFEDHPTKTDKYISNSLGLTQESINYLRSRKSKIDKIENENKKKRQMIQEKIELEEVRITGQISKKEERRLKSLTEQYENNEFNELKSTDDIIDVINILISDMKKEDSTKVLLELSKYLKNEGLETLVGVEFQNKEKFISKLNILKQNLDMLKQDQRIEYLRESGKDVIDAYNSCFVNNEYQRFSEKYRLKVYMEKINLKLENLRIKLNEKNSL